MNFLDLQTNCDQFNFCFAFYIEYTQTVKVLCFKLETFVEWQLINIIEKQWIEESVYKSFYESVCNLMQNIFFE